MSSVLALARDFIERMSNPVFGLSTNEEYSLEFGQLLQSEEFTGQLRRDIESLRDPAELTSYGWMWLFGWARANRVTVQGSLLVTLFEQWSSVFVKAAIVDLATAEPEVSQGRAEPIDGSDVIENRVIAQIVARATHDESFRDRDERDVSGVVMPLGRSEATLIALLQVGRPATLRAARALLRRRWSGQERLLEFFWSLADSLEEETRTAWVRQVNPPQRPSSAR